MHAKYEASISYGSKVIANVKVDNRQTNKQTNRQDKNNMPPIIRYRGIKKLLYHVKGLVTRNTHVQYESPNNSGLKVMAKVEII